MSNHGDDTGDFKTMREGVLGRIAAAESRPAPTHEMRILDHTGDTLVTWNPESEADVETARQMFDDLRGKGYLAYKVSEGGGRSRRMVRTFDPSAERLIMVPRPVGG